MLLIVESPSKCTKIESFIRCKCISSKGHIRELKKLPHKPSDEPIYEIISEKKAHIESMKKIIKNYSKDSIYIATDDDREGEAIAWHICQVFNLPIETTKRIIFHEVTKSALEKAVNNPTLINMNIVKAQKARQVLDLMVGFKISPILWKYLYRSKNNSLSAGRCQTPALRLVYDNQQEKKQAVIRQTYKIIGTFFPKKIEFVLSKEFESDEKVLTFLEASKGFKHVLSIGVKKENIKSPPRPFNTSSLLQVACSNLRMSPKETMSACQKLYQDGHITYMRTESQSYSAEFLQDIQKYILQKKTKEYLGDLEKLVNKDQGNPHEAIRITHLEVNSIEDANPKIRRLYELIWKNTVESCMSAARFEQTPVYMSCPQMGSDESDLRYIHVIEVPIFLGWRSLSSQLVVESLAFYMSTCPKEQLALMIQSKIAVHGRHSHYTEASLIKKLEDIDIGRPSTYASLVETIIDRGYVKKIDIEGDVYECIEYVLENGEIKSEKTEKIIGQEKGKLVIQPTGILVAEFLTEHFGPLFDYGYTKNMEKDLDKLACGEYQKDICVGCHKQIEDLIKPVEKRMFVLKDTDEYIVVFGRYGAVLQSKTREFKSVQIQIDMDRLIAGDYTLAELENRGDEVIGNHEGYDVVLMNGPFGLYIKYKEENIGLNIIETFDKSKDECENEDANGGKDEPKEESNIFDKFMKWYTRPKEENTKIIRELSDGVSIRNGKYGAYIHHQTKEMKKPKFYKLKGFKESYRLCQKDIIIDWIKKTYNIE